MIADTKVVMLTNIFPIVTNFGAKFRLKRENDVPALYGLYGVHREESLRDTKYEF